MKWKVLKGVAILTVLLGASGVSASVYASGNNWLHGTLRVDSAAIRDARRYTMLVAAAAR
jgi:hypothetical protein